MSRFAFADDPDANPAQRAGLVDVRTLGAPGRTYDPAAVKEQRKSADRLYLEHVKAAEAQGQELSWQQKRTLWQAMQAASALDAK